MNLLIRGTKLGLSQKKRKKYTIFSLFLLLFWRMSLFAYHFHFSKSQLQKLPVYLMRQKHLKNCSLWLLGTYESMKAVLPAWVERVKITVKWPLLAFIKIVVVVVILCTFPYLPSYCKWHCFTKCPKGSKASESSFASLLYNITKTILSLI